MLLAICHSAETGWTRVDDLATLSELRDQSGHVLWAEAAVDDLTQEDIELIGEEFDLHPLAVEDAISTRQRPKIESYEGHRFFVFHQLDEVSGQLEASQIACFVGDRFVLTIHAGASRTIEGAKERWRAAENLPEHSSALLHTIFDVVVDDYQRIADDLEQEIEDLEELALETPGAPLQRQLYSVKQKISRMRRYVFPASRLLDWSSEKSTVAAFAPETQPLFRDVQDHLLRIADEVRNVDDLAQAVLDLTRSEQSNVLNEVSRKLSAYAAIFAVLTLIAGVYGMNFDLLPADGSRVGFWFALALMGVSGSGLYLYFRRRGWL